MYLPLLPKTLAIFFTVFVNFSVKPNEKKLWCNKALCKLKFLSCEQLYQYSTITQKLVSKYEPPSALLESDECITVVNTWGRGKKELIYTWFPCFVICSMMSLTLLGWRLRCNNGNTPVMSPASTWEQAWDELDEGRCLWEWDKSVLQEDLRADFSLGVWKKQLT